jgi:phospholipid-transporting ATPase
MPLTQDAQMPAGHGQGQIGDPVGSSARNMSMLDEEDEEMTQARARLAAMQARKRIQSDKPVWLKVWTEVKRRAKRGPKVYIGDRIINLGNRDLATPVKYPGNSVSTSKYNLVTFVPKFLAGELVDTGV